MCKCENDVTLGIPKSSSTFKIHVVINKGAYQTTWICRLVCTLVFLMHQCQVCSGRGTRAEKIGFMIWLGKFIYTVASLVVQVNDMISKMEEK